MVLSFLFELRRHILRNIIELFAKGTRVSYIGMYMYVCENFRANSESVSYKIAAGIFATRRA